MPLKCVPLVQALTDPSGKPDAKAIYRRRKQDNWGNPELDANGREQWDYTSGLPMRRHGDWTAKGYEYVTLADAASLELAAPFLAAQGIDARQFANQDLRTRSPWNAALYLEDAKSNREREYDELKALVEQFGAEAVLGIKRAQNPAFELPADLASVPAPKKGKKGEPVSA